MICKRSLSYERRISEKVSLHQIKNSPATSGPRIGTGSRRVKEAINSTENVCNNNNNNIDDDDDDDDNNNVQSQV